MSKKNSKTAKAEASNGNRESNAHSKADEDKSKTNETPKVLTIIEELLLMIDGDSSTDLKKSKKDKQPNKGKIKSSNQKDNKLKDVQNALKKLDLVIGKEKQRDISIYEEKQNIEPDLNSKISGDIEMSHASVTSLEIVPEKAEMDTEHSLGITSITTHPESEHAKTTESNSAEHIAENSVRSSSMISTETVVGKIGGDENCHVPTEYSDDKSIPIPETPESEDSNIHIENSIGEIAVVEKIVDNVEIKVEVRAVRAASAYFLSLNDSEQKKEFCLNCREIEECNPENVHLIPRGFENVGNTCYRNSVLQSLLSLPPFISLCSSILSKFPPSSIPIKMPLWGEFLAFFDGFREENDVRTTSSLPPSIPSTPSSLPPSLPSSTPSTAVNLSNSTPLSNPPTTHSIPLTQFAEDFYNTDLEFDSDFTLVTSKSKTVIPKTVQVQITNSKGSKKSQKNGKTQRRNTEENKGAANTAAKSASLAGTGSGGIIRGTAYPPPVYVSTPTSSSTLTPDHFMKNLFRSFEKKMQEVCTSTSTSNNNRDHNDNGRNGSSATGDDESCGTSHGPKDFPEERRTITIAGKGISQSSTVDSSKGAQEDAMEFMTYLLDALHMEMSGGDEGGEREAEEEAQADSGWATVAKAKVKNIVDDSSRQNAAKSIAATSISRMFHGTLRSEVIYANKRTMSSTFQRFHCLTLDPSDDNYNNSPKDNSSEKNTVDIGSTMKLKDMNFPPLKSGGEKKLAESSVQVPSQKYSINSALENYFRVETLGQGIRKSVSLDHLPPILVLQINRFAFNVHRGTILKVDSEIEYQAVLTLPSTFFSLELNEKLAAVHKNNGDSAEKNGIKVLGDKSVNYSLCAVVRHHGNSTHTGHYTAVCKGANNTWREFDDASVSKVDLSYALSATKSAFLLFYNRI